jgi:hypothetical protein
MNGKQNDVETNKRDERLDEENPENPFNHRNIVFASDSCTKKIPRKRNFMKPFLFLIHSFFITLKK